MRLEKEPLLQIKKQILYDTNKNGISSMGNMKKTVKNKDAVPSRYTAHHYSLIRI